MRILCCEITKRILWFFDKVLFSIDVGTTKRKTVIIKTSSQSVVGVQLISHSTFNVLVIFLSQRDSKNTQNFLNHSFPVTALLMRQPNYNQITINYANGTHYHKSAHANDKVPITKKKKKLSHCSIPNYSTLI